MSEPRDVRSLPVGGKAYKPMRGTVTEATLTTTRTEADRFRRVLRDHPQLASHRVALWDVARLVKMGRPCTAQDVERLLATVERQATAEREARRLEREMR